MQKKMLKTWTGKKSPTNPERKEQHQDRKTKEELVHQWQEADWDSQYEEYLDYASESFQE